MPADYQHAPAEAVQATQPPSASFDEQVEQARKLANDGQPELALAAYHLLLARSPGNVDVLLGRGIVLSRLERWAEAEADLGAAAKAAPEYADVWFALGNLYQWQDQPARAAEAYGRAAALRPQDAAARLAQARALGAMQPAPVTPAAPAKPVNPEAALASGHTWVAGLHGNWQDVGAGTRWNDQTLSVRRYLQGGSIGVEALRAHRFDQAGRAWAIDAYASLWNGAYANLRYQRAPGARLFPANAGRVELYQSLGNGWEASLSNDVLGFDTRVNIYGVGLARYTGNFYVQLRHQNIVSGGARSSGDRLLGRWYYTGEADNHVEMTVNRGRSDDLLSLTSGRARSGGGSLAWVHYLSRDWGGKIGASYARTDGGAGGRERGVSIGLYRRW
ncbi:YaiO family outer membrane beta-barrel protein [Massilia consociata]|uniref:YaiO family outer membrane beta-barrel protein n=1 Tax=Massilia consociata TaxID=760117 RepID=A0ABV6FHM1_9BURK